MPMMLRSAATLACAVLALSGCGGSESGDEEAVAAAAGASASPSIDPARAWRNAVTGLCKDLAGEVSGQQLTDGADGKITPAEILAGEQAARPAVEDFDAGLAALAAPPEAADMEKVLTGYLARMGASVPDLLAAAQAGDQAALDTVLAEREAVRLSPAGNASLTAVGLPENCEYRASYS